MIESREPILHITNRFTAITLVIEPHESGEGLGEKV
jgi:hypothetical protein